MTVPSSKKPKEELDPNPLELGDMDWKQETAAKENKSRILGKRLCSGESLVDIIDDGNQDLVFKFKHIDDSVKAYFRAKQR